MTLAVVFQRRVLNHFELVFASDSRLTGGQVNDHAQKIFQLARSDALLAFAGDTKYAYPLMMQLLRSIESYPFSADRRLPLSKLKGHALRVFQQSYSSIHSLPVGQKYPDDPDNYFFLGGYDWQTSSFRTWLLAFAPSQKKFVFRQVAGSGRNSFFFISDDRRAVKHSIAETMRLLYARGKSQDEIDVEPLDVLIDVIRDPLYPSIGGAPQVGKVYGSLNSMLFQVKWSPDGSSPSISHVAGRPLLPGERCLWPLFDPALGFYSIRQIEAKGEADPDGE